MYSREKMVDIMLYRTPPSSPLSDEQKDTLEQTLPHQHSALFSEMIMLIESQKLYLNPKLDLKQVITLLGTNKFYLYNAINNHSESNFRNIINRYRLEEAKRIIERECRQGEADNSTTIYEAAGFNSAATYYRIFKQHTGLTPMEYAKEYRNDTQRVNPPNHEG